MLIARTFASRILPSVSPSTLSNGASHPMDGGINGSSSNGGGSPGGLRRGTVIVVARVAMVLQKVIMKKKTRHLRRWRQ